MKRKLKRWNGTNTCFTDCVAFILDVHPRKVPFFIEHHAWFWYVKKFFRRRGYEIRAYKFKTKLLSNKRKYYIVSGLSFRSKIKNPDDMRSMHHAIVYRGKKKYWDPNGPHGRGIRGKPSWVYVIRKAKSPQ